MGCTDSKLERNYERMITNTLAPVHELFAILDIGPKDQKQLFKVFDRMDRDGGKKIDFEEVSDHTATIGDHEQNHHVSTLYPHTTVLTTCPPPSDMCPPPVMTFV